MSETADREIRLTRLLKAPRELVWQVWTDPAHVDHWWGPNGFQNATHEMQVAPGGVWRYMMHGPNGVDYPNRIDYLEVVRPEKLVYDHGADDGAPAHFHVVVTFDEDPAGTLLTLCLIFPTAEARDQVIREHGAIEGGNQTLARLAEYVEPMAASH